MKTNENTTDNGFSLNNDIARYRNRLIDRAEETNFRTSQFFRAFNSPTPNTDELSHYANQLISVLDDFREQLTPYLKDENE